MRTTNAFNVMRNKIIDETEEDEAENTRNHRNTQLPKNLYRETERREEKEEEKEAEEKKKRKLK